MAGPVECRRGIRARDGSDQSVGHRSVWRTAAGWAEAGRHVDRHLAKEEECVGAVLPQKLDVIKQRRRLVVVVIMHENFGSREATSQVGSLPGRLYEPSARADATPSHDACVVLSFACDNASAGQRSRNKFPVAAVASHPVAAKG